MPKIFIRVLLLILVGAALAGGIYTYKMRQVEQLKGRSLDEFKEDLGKLEIAAGDLEALRSACGSFHEQAWSRAFVREDLTGGTLKVGTYRKAMFQGLLEWAEPGKNQELLSILRYEIETIGDDDDSESDEDSSNRSGG